MPQRIPARSPLRTLALMCLCACVLVCLCGLTQPTTPTPLDRQASAAILRLSLADLRSIESPQARDYSITLALLDAAQSLDPSDTDIARRRNEAAWNAGDTDELLAATQKIIELDPKDTVAQLRFLTERIGKSQTSAERLSAYERAVTSNLDPAIRSRLAFDAAMLYKERADEPNFLRLLKQATQLDPTNKEAAVTAFQFYTEKAGTTSGPTVTLGKLELLSNLLMADPLDPEVHGEVRDLLAGQQAFKAAKRFHEIVLKIYDAGGLGADPQLQLQSLILQWHNDGASAALKNLLNELGKEREVAQQQAEAGAKGGLQIGLNPADVRLASSFEEVRMAAAIATSDDAELGRSFADLEKTVDHETSILSDPTRRPARISTEQAKERMTELARKVQFWRPLIATLAPKGLTPPAPPPDKPDSTKPDAKPDPSKPDPTKPASPAPTPSPAPPPAPAADTAQDQDPEPAAQAWQAIAAHDYDKALAAIDADADDPWSLFARALALELQAKNQDASAAYRKLIESYPLTALGALAYVREEALSHNNGGPLPSTAPFDSFARTVPTWIDGMVEKPWTFQSLRADPTASRVAALDRATIHLRLRNLSPIPLALGTGRPINTRLLFSPSLDAIGQNQPADAEVIEVDRRLRLMPGDELDLTVWPESGSVGAQIEDLSINSTRLRWRIMQGFEAQGQAGRRAGPGCLEVQTDPIIHDPLPEAKLSPEDLAAKIAQAKDDQVPALLVATRLLIEKKDFGATKAIEALAARLPTLSPTARLLAAAALPQTPAFPALKPIDDALAMDQDPKVLLVAAIARAATKDDPIIAAAVASKDSTTSKAATAQQARIKEGIKTYSQQGAPAAPINPAAPAPIKKP